MMGTTQQLVDSNVLVPGCHLCSDRTPAVSRCERLDKYMGRKLVPSSVHKFFFFSDKNSMAP